MGRVKLKIKRMENTNGLLATYAKRKNRIMKKAAELAILCGVYIILLMFSPSGKPSLCRGKHKYFCVLKKTFKKLDHDVNIQDFFGYWTDLGTSNSVEQLGQMENSLKESLNQIRSHKENIQKQEFASLQCNNQRARQAILLGVMPMIMAQVPKHIFQFLSKKMVQLTPEMKPNENHVDYNVNGTIEAARTEYDSNHQGWTSTSGPCVIHALMHITYKAGTAQGTSLSSHSLRLYTSLSVKASSLINFLNNHYYFSNTEDDVNIKEAMEDLNYIPKQLFWKCIGIPKIYLGITYSRI
ncbi:Agamous-like MADS-box protein AGL30 [Glycine max]|nr:Agamous-like MADS-box protein AGL30 [Glycine max]